MKRDLAEMEHMIDEYLAFARGEGGEAVETVDLRELIERGQRGRACAPAPRSASTADPELTAAVRPNALKRALSNLVMNAAVHGEHVEVAAAAAPRAASRSSSTTTARAFPQDRYEEAFKAVRPPRRGPQPERQGRGPGPRHRPRRRPRPRRRRHASTARRSAACGRGAACRAPRSRRRSAPVARASASGACRSRPWCG